MPETQDKIQTTRELADFVVAVLEELKAEDIRSLDVRHLTSITDTMIIASGRSDRHVRAVADALVERCKQAGRPPLGVEGQRGGEWVLVDLGDIVVHVMLRRTREFYDIEKLWDISSLRRGAAER
jgi:ribosome-associated protein